MAKFVVDFVYKTYHTAEIDAESPDKALDQVMAKTYGVEPDWESDKDFLKETLDDDDPYNALSVEAHVDCQFVWQVHTPDDYFSEFDLYDSFDEAHEAAGDKYEISSEVLEFDKKEYAIPCKFAEEGGICVELRPEHIATILPLLKGEIEGDRDSVLSRVAYNRLLLALEGERARSECYAPRAVNHAVDQ
jgi:hypothetical protein